VSGFYYAVYRLIPESLKRRINPLEYKVKRFVASAAGNAPRLVVDAGAGEVRFRELFDPGTRYVALDRGVGDISWDYSRLDVVADLGAIPLASGRADIVINTQVLEHVRSPEDVIGELSRVLRVGGMLYLTVPQGWPEHQQPNDYFRFTRFALQMLLDRAGFSKVEIGRLGGYFHYLGHRLSYIPKIIFQQRRGPGRILLFPIELLSLILFCFAAPMLCYYLDRLDRSSDFTLCYWVRAVK
jgi:SAM-dependent methyltransferase